MNSTQPLSDWVAWCKVVLAAFGAGMISAGQSVEPSEAVWVMATAGGMLGVAVGEDRSIRTILVHVALGIVAGLACAALVDALTHLPRAPVAMFAGLFAARATVWINREIDANGPWAALPSWFRKGP